jgi:two-component system response regulator FlrC
MRLLIVGTLKGQLSIATKMAVDKGAAVTNAEDIETALRVMRAKGADLVMVDVAWTSGRWSQAFADEMIAVPIVACGTSNDARAAVAAIHAGAKEYIPLPPDPELIAAVLAAVADDAKQPHLDRDEAMARVVQLANQVAGSDASRSSSPARAAPARRCWRATSTPSRTAPRQALRRGELRRDSRQPAGERALRPREGRLHRRRRPPHRQVRGGQRRHAAARRNLRDGYPPAVQAAARHPGAGDRPRRRHPPVPVDIRILATSNRTLADEAGPQGHVPRGPVLPPQRREPEAAAAARAAGRHPRTRRPFRPKYAEANGMPPKPLSAEARRQLTVARWPGNVRELENTLHRAVLLSTGRRDRRRRHPHPGRRPARRAARAATVAAQAAIAAEAVTRGLVGRTVADVERDLILDTLGHTLGNRTHAANILGISIRTLRNKLRRRP